MHNQTAFPQVEIDRISGQIIDQHYGISMRDYFAAKFIAAWVVALAARRDQFSYSDKETMFEAIRLGTKQADAMLAERSK